MPDPLRYALIHVTSVRAVTPHMMRISFGGDLAGFTSVAPDQQVKLFFGKPGMDVPVVPQVGADGDTMRWYQAYLAVPEAERPWMRAYSIRRHRPADNEVDIDFVLHGDGGPASAWALRAEPGDVIGMLGPTVSHIRTPGPHDWRLIVGDETALPAIGAILEALPAGLPVRVVAEVSGPDEEQDLSSEAAADVRWVHRGNIPPGRSGLLLDAVRAMDFPDGAVYAWVAGEASGVRAVRRHLVNERSVPKRAIAFTGYWRCDLPQDADPTPDEVAENAEMMAEG
ncbi:NADPH-dependent ferric siderophore reductase [Murinocardiopsis flavida]|uniref:NADPH-dependent ferric siderophore reductase n=1 Tax=Murinocardiopsis flavida TaxID=645275 RepID=A0A2P8DS63_9ACTN|nr:siderophore-interacting protein [Murinocardiopsis flavida]PSL00048.1 NADPH-dependent ferric siderophore reductase [Murinocardiopsis flavida]